MAAAFFLFWMILNCVEGVRLVVPERVQAVSRHSADHRLLPDGDLGDREGQPEHVPHRVF